MKHVALADGVITEKPNCFIPVFGGRRGGGCLLMNSKKLVVEYPFGLNVVVRRAAQNPTLKLPGTSQVID